MYSLNSSWGKTSHIVRQLNGRDKTIDLPAEFQIVTEDWNRAVAFPFLAHMPETDSLLMLVACDYPQTAMVMFSTDRGATWSNPVSLHMDEQGKPSVDRCFGLNYLGCGKAMCAEIKGRRCWLSNDYGKTWQVGFSIPPFPGGEAWYRSDPFLVDKDNDTGKVVRLVETGCLLDKAAYQSDSDVAFAEGYIRFSADEGQTWCKAVKVPQWCNVAETALCRAQNGDIIAACRAGIPAKLKPLKYHGKTPDHYMGLGISISRDNGYTWSNLHMLYEWGRHHPSLVLLPNDDIVMTYVVRLGYDDTPDGFPQYGVEAVVSSDHGKTWDLDHRYLLATWRGLYKRPTFFCSSQCTSSLLLPDGAILTAFGTGYRVRFGPGGEGDHPTPRDIGLVKWQTNSKGLNSDRTIADAPFDSDLRNRFELNG